jgi:hypothetical protein
MLPPVGISRKMRWSPLASLPSATLSPLSLMYSLDTGLPSSRSLTSMTAMTEGFRSQ